MANRTRRKRRRGKRLGLEIYIYKFFGLLVIISILINLTVEVINSIGQLISEMTLIEKAEALLFCGFLVFLYTLARKREKQLKDVRQAERERMLEKMKQDRIKKMKAIKKLDEIKKMTPFEFEHFIREMYELLGYQARVTSQTGDGGKDIILYKNSIKKIVECKRYNKIKVTRPEIQKFHSAIIDTNASKGVFITTGGYTAPAVKYVENKPIELINGDNLISMLSGLSSCVPESEDLTVANTLKVQKE